MGEVDFSAKDSEYAKKHIANLSKMGYNQYRSTKVAFEYGNAPTGTQRMLYNPQKNQFEVWEKGDDTIVSMGIAKPGKEAEKLYERIYGRKAGSVYESIKTLQNSKDDNIWNMQLSQNGGNDAGNGEQTVGERAGNTSGRSGANLPESNNGKSINNEPSSNDGGFSMPKFSTKDSNDKELTKEQQEYFKNSKVRDENEKTRNRPLSSHGLKNAIAKKQTENEFLSDLLQIRKAYARSEYHNHSVVNSIPAPAENVKQKSLRDSNGKELTKEQQEYFKDSKVRDENEKTRNRPLSSRCCNIFHKVMTFDLL